MEEKETVLALHSGHFTLIVTRRGSLIFSTAPFAAQCTELWFQNPMEAISYLIYMSLIHVSSDIWLGSTKAIPCTGMTLLPPGRALSPWKTLNKEVKLMACVSDSWPSENHTWFLSYGAQVTNESLNLTCNTSQNFPTLPSSCSDLTTVLT